MPRMFEVCPDPDAPGLYEIRHVPIYETHNSRGYEADEQFIDDVIADYEKRKRESVEKYGADPIAAFEVPVHIGHNDPSKPSEEKEAVGYLTKLYRVGAVLFSNIGRLTREWADALRNGKYPNRSVEIADKAKCLLSLALLTRPSYFDLPQMKRFSRENLSIVRYTLSGDKFMTKKDRNVLLLALGTATLAYHGLLMTKGPKDDETVKAYGQVQMCMSEVAEADKTETPTTKYEAVDRNGTVTAESQTAPAGVPEQGTPGQTTPQSFAKEFEAVRSYAKSLDENTRKQVETFASAMQGIVEKQAAQIATLSSQLQGSHDLIKNYDKGLRNLQEKAAAADAERIQTLVTTEFSKLKGEGCTALGDQKHIEGCIKTAVSLYGKGEEYDTYMATFRNAPKVDMTKRYERGTRNIVPPAGAVTVLDGLKKEAVTSYSKDREKFDRAGIDTTTLAIGALSEALFEGGDDEE